MPESGAKIVKFHCSNVFIYSKAICYIVVDAFGWEPVIGAKGLISTETVKCSN